MSVTRLCFSFLKVPATTERPASHQGTERPEAKNSEVFLPERLPKKSAGAKQIPTATSAMIQSSAVRCMRRPFRFLRMIRASGSVPRGVAGRAERAGHVAEGRGRDEHAVTLRPPLHPVEVLGERAEERPARPRDAA